MKKGSVLVVGGGIGGIEAALDVAESGFEAYILESSPSIGGLMAMLDKTFPTNDCSMCILSPKLVEASQHPNIEIITLAQIKEIKGGPGDFAVEYIQNPRFVSTELCTGCGACSEACVLSERIPSEFDAGLSKRSAIYIPFAQSVPRIALIDTNACLKFTKGKCKAPCQEACTAKAIDFDQKPEPKKIEVGSIVAATGAHASSIKELSPYHPEHPNVVSSIQLERIMCASGPYAGKIVRPSDGKPAKRIAFVQCAGSRDIFHNPYCSGVCCTYAIKQATVIKEHDPDIACHIFHIDMRTFGKGFERFKRRAEDEYGIRFTRFKIPSVEIAGPDTLRIRFLTEDGWEEDEFDIVSLSVGLKASPITALEKAGVKLNQYGFIETKQENPTETSVPGIFACGSATGPKDIPETVSQAAGASGNCSSILSEARGTLIQEKELPPEADTKVREPRIGVFVCHCGKNIANFVDTGAVAEYARTLGNVVYVEENTYTCSSESCERIKQAIHEHQLTRVVVAACTPRTHEKLFRDTIREAGLNRYLLEFANIRDQCSWVHSLEPERATEKAKDLVGMSVSRARLLEPLPLLPVKVNHEALVIGGGPAGISSALVLAKSGFKTHIVEKEEHLGGGVNSIPANLGIEETEDIRTGILSVISELKKLRNVVVHTSSRVVDFSGYIGNFRALVQSGEGLKEIKPGAVIVATGGREHIPSSYLFGKSQKVMTQKEFRQKLPTLKAKSVVMIQCVEGRNEERPYCSRVCCIHALMNAIAFKERNTGANVFVLYRDIVVYALHEELYRKARERGILFIRYDDKEPPQIKEEENGLTVNLNSPQVPHEIEIETDLVVLSTPVVPDDENVALSEMMKIPTDEDGFFLEAHVKLRPLDFSTAGIFLAGTCHHPKLACEAISQGLGAAGRAITVLSKEYVIGEGAIAKVDPKRCRGCGACEDACEFGAISVKSDGTKIPVAEVNEALCVGCGMCAVSCWSDAITISHFTDEQIEAMIRSAVK
ncbi:MAG: FAD-dependent oxidoreductase [Actinomycetota bacterium]|nr:FAD-dependent oxidoreductase [Actinomycetota bacterium]